jgi:coiled-coil domain-containing protein 61
MLLTLEVEDEESGDRWSGEFTSQCMIIIRGLLSIDIDCLLFLDIEEITHKAGNFKKFSLFVEMLSSAFSKSNKSVFIDLLTLSDLEMMKAKKSGTQSNAGSSLAVTNKETTKRNFLKRYAILTYTGEFDRVHYPLPLAFEETPNIVSLQRSIRRLRERLKANALIQQEPSNEKERLVNMYILFYE